MMPGAGDEDRHSRGESRIKRFWLPRGAARTDPLRRSERKKDGFAGGHAGHYPKCQPVEYIVTDFWWQSVPPNELHYHCSSHQGVP